MNAKDQEDNLIVKLTFEFAVASVRYVEQLEERRKFVIANQLFKSATSIGANVREAQNAESKSDFVHKIKIAAKEADETEYWLQICSSIENYPSTTELLKQLHSIQKILNRIISTSKSRPTPQSANQHISTSAN